MLNPVIISALFFLPIVLVAMASSFLAVCYAYASDKADTLDAEVTGYISEMETLRKAWLGLGQIIERQAIAFELRVNKAVARTDAIRQARFLRLYVPKVLKRHGMRVNVNIAMEAPLFPSPFAFPTLSEVQASGNWRKAIRECGAIAGHAGEKRRAA